MEIKGTDITMITGDSESITISLYDSDNVKIVLDTGDIVYFSVKTNSNQKGYVFQKIITEFTEGNATIEISPTDTKILSNGTYIYDIQLTQLDGTISTIVKPSKFILIKGVTNE